MRRRDPWFLDEYTVNPFSACLFNCLFCYIRGSKYGEHLQDAFAVKSNAVEMLRKQLAARAGKKQFGFIVISSATDPYPRQEAELQLTRRLLEVILEFRFPVHIITRGTVVTRDIDLLKEIHQRAILPEGLREKLSGGALVTFSFSTLDDEVASIFEPGAPPPSARIQTLQTIHQSGLKTGVSLMPLLPYISDTGEQLRKYFEVFRDAGAQYVMPAGLSLYGRGKADSRTLVMNAVSRHFPHLKEKYEKLFGSSDNLPAYYQMAFSQRMNELKSEFQMPDRIIPV